MEIDKVREQFPIVKKKVFMDHARLAPCSKLVRRAIEKSLLDWQNREEYILHLGGRGTPVLEARELFARLVGARAENMAFVPNTSEGIDAAIFSLDYPDGSNVVTADLEFPSVVYPLLNLRKLKGVEVRYVRNTNGRLETEDFERIVDDKTVAVVVSHVEYRNGFRNDLRAISEIAHRHGAKVVVDATQSAGAIEVDVEELRVDFLACACFKWIMGAIGTGFLYVKESLVDELNPIYVGWVSAAKELIETLDIEHFHLASGPARFETGTINVHGYVGTAEAIRLLLRVGMPNVEKRILQITDYLIEGLERLGISLRTVPEPKCRSGIVTFSLGDFAAVNKRLRAQGFELSAFPALQGIRASPHFYNTEGEVDRLLAELHRLI